MTADKIAKYRDPAHPERWWLTDFTMEQVERRIASLEKQLSEARAALAERDAALRGLLVWAKWVKKKVHQHPRMDEPNTGAIMAAEAALSEHPPASDKPRSAPKENP